MSQHTNIIQISGGNDSVALLQWVIENRNNEVFSNQNFIATYCNTGWSADYWNNERIPAVKEFCEANYITFIEIMSPGMENLIRKKTMFPSMWAKWCTKELKIIPHEQWRKANGFNFENSTVFIGVRREESARRADTTSTAILNEKSNINKKMFAVYPLAYYKESERNKLIEKAGFEVLPHRSQECYPCIYQGRKDFLRTLDKSRIDVITNLENDVTTAAVAYKKEHDPGNYDPNEHFGFFGSTGLVTPRSPSKGVKIAELVQWARGGRGQNNLQQETIFGDLAEADITCANVEGFCGG